MAKKSADLNVFLANLATLNIKVHNLHWNVVGENFLPLHKMTEMIYQMLHLQFDETAELMKTQNMYPAASLAEYLDRTTVAELESRSYTGYEVLQELDAECQNLMDNAMKIRNDADKKDNFILVNLMEKYLEMYAKQSWQIKAMLEEYEEIEIDGELEEDEEDYEEQEEHEEDVESLDNGDKD